MPNTYLTPEDEQYYGRDLIDFTTRAATQAVAPYLQNLEQQNATLQRRLAREQRHRLDQQVTAAVPNWPEIDQNPRWHAWLSTVDPLSGCPRQRLLDDAIASGSAERCAAFFQSFMREQRDSRSTPAHSRPRPAQSSSNAAANQSELRNEAKRCVERQGG
ncbi:MAG TPA: hypothetical protein VM910_29440 [Bradyrhizobium sp.]|nr:hypothetical protein [Bradyrhizobium sp.]